MRSVSGLTVCRLCKSCSVAIEAAVRVISCHDTAHSQCLWLVTHFIVFECSKEQMLMFCHFRFCASEMKPLGFLWSPICSVIPLWKWKQCQAKRVVSIIWGGPWPCHQMLQVPKFCIDEFTIRDMSNVWFCFCSCCHLSSLCFSKPNLYRLYIVLSQCKAPLWGYVETWKFGSSKPTDALQPGV